MFPLSLRPWRSWRLEFPGYPDDTMFNDPQDESSDAPLVPADRAREKTDESRMHAELFAVFEAVRKFDAELKPSLDANLARDVQRGMAKLEKSKSLDHPVLPEESIAPATDVLNFATTHDLSLNDYHIHRRPGEVMIIRWIAGEQVDTFYKRLQAHFDAAFGGLKEDEHQALEWKQDPKTLEYLKLLDAVEVNMAERYLRPVIVHPQAAGLAFVLSTQTADEINIAYLCDYVMGVTIPDLVGSKSAPPDEPSEHDMAWFFKLFSLRGKIDGIEKMCFFAYLQKTEDTFELDED